MSDCSTHAMEYPGVTRIKVFFTDKTEREIDYPFVTLDREIEYVAVDGEKWVSQRKAMELARANGELQALVHELESELAFTTCKCGEDIECEGSDTAVCPSCGRVVVR